MQTGCGLFVETVRTNDIRFQRFTRDGALTCCPRPGPLVRGSDSLRLVADAHWWDIHCAVNDGT
jgi:hypothetical protein